MTKNKLGDNSRQRIEVMTRSNDGFEIAEADMKLCAPGDIEGTQQSGLPINLKIANLGRDQHCCSLSGTLLKKFWRKTLPSQRSGKPRAYPRTKKSKQKQIALADDFIMVSPDSTISVNPLTTFWPFLSTH
jgi:RecG-like helicase